MSGDQVAPSFVEPNTEPPTPKQTPTSSVVPSPLFETPKDLQAGFDESPAAGWTPRFAEDYSVFNSTPGNLRGTQGPFADFVSSTTGSTPVLHPPPTPGAQGQRKRTFAESVAAEIATHANHFSPNPDAPLPPVEPSQRLQSSPDSVAAQFDRSPDDRHCLELSSQESSKKARRKTGIERAGERQGKEAQGQTVTPPPSARKGGRKPAPRRGTSKMQNDQGYNQQEYMAGDAHQQANMGHYVTPPNDMFSYPLSAPATAASFADHRAFWGADPNMAGMDMDFGGVSNGHVFQTNASSQHQSMGSVDWSNANQMFHAHNGMVSQPNQENMQELQHGESALISKAAMPLLDTGHDGQDVFVGTYAAPIPDPFGIVQNVGAVNPGLLFSRPQSSNLNAPAFTRSTLPDASSVPSPPQTANSQAPPVHETKVKETPQRGQPPRRSMSVRDPGPTKSKPADRSFASSPTKPCNRPRVGRSFSESRGKKATVRTSLPPLAPAPRTQQSGPSISRATISRPNQQSGRISPTKSDHYNRLSHLSAIPESISPVPRTRTQATFTIDSNGRARVETTVIVDDDLPPPLSVRKRYSDQSMQHYQHPWSTSGSEREEDDDSSTDEDPIIIPSRNASFALPDPVRPSRRNPLHLSQRSVSEHSTTSYTSFTAPHEQYEEEADSEAETVMNDMTPMGGGRLGDAAAELKKLRAARQNRPASSPVKSKHQRYASGSGGAAIADFASHRGPRYTILSSSPTKLTESNLPTPASSGGQGVRCICNRSDLDHETDGYMVQCESCESWLHGRCVNITKRTMPTVYICLFCANTPNLRGGRTRDGGRPATSDRPPTALASPLAHKSFKSFR